MIHEPRREKPIMKTNHENQYRSCSASQWNASRWKNTPSSRDILEWVVDSTEQL
jgi:hypothetical protein